jgi:peptidyl-prolyl cis-trans isomerase B (cyclophilin B)
MYNVSAVETDFVKIEMESGDSIVIQLDEKSAPITVANFKKLVGQGFYNGLIFHRVISGFMIQGGDPEGTGMGGSKENIRGEFLYNGIKNPISHVRGVISMARAQNPNSASSQFFICADDQAYLDAQYAAFGKVCDEESMQAVLDIASVKTTSWGYYDDVPVEPVVMKKVYMIEE